MLKDSVYAASAIETLQKEEGLEGVQIAMDLNVSPQLVSNIKHGHRKLQKDIAKTSLATYDCPDYAMELLYEFSEGFTAPVLRGKAIEQHRLAFKEFLRNEAKEAFEKLKEVNLMKSPSNADKEDVEQIKGLIAELDDTEIAIANFKRILAKEYCISLKELKKQRAATLKAKGWI